MSLVDLSSIDRLRNDEELVGDIGLSSVVGSSVAAAEGDFGVVLEPSSTNQEAGEGGIQFVIASLCSLVKG